MLGGHTRTSNQEFQTPYLRFDWNPELERKIKSADIAVDRYSAQVYLDSVCIADSERRLTEPPLH